KLARACSRPTAGQQHDESNFSTSPFSGNQSGSGNVTIQSSSSEIEMLGQQLQAMTAAVVGEPSISAPNLRTTLRFINRVIEVVDQAFGEVYAVLVEISLLEEDDLFAGRVREVRRSIELLTMRSR